MKQLSLGNVLLGLCALFVCASAVLPDDDNCGVPAIQPADGNRIQDGRIVGGREAVPHSWPWQVLIRYNGLDHCGGTVISPDTVLTAAHCFRFFSASGFSFRFGRHSKLTPESSEQIASAQRVTLHESYNIITKQNDIALIRISPPVTYTPQVSPICLPKQTTELLEDEQVHITGWGDTKNTCCPDVLKQVKLPIISRTKCNQPDYYNGRVRSGMICAGLEEGGLDSCQGDSGGPLVIEKDGRWQQFGVVSWGDGCADAKKPGVYASTVYYDAWIRAKVSQFELEERQTAAKFRPAPFGAAFRQVARELVMKGEVRPQDLPLNGEWMQ